MPQGLDLGNVLSQAESIKGQRLQNQLLGQKQQGNVLLQNFLAQGGGVGTEGFNQLPVNAQKNLIGIETGQQNINIAQQEQEKVEAQQAFDAAANVLRSKSPKALMLAAYPQFVEQLKEQGVDLDALTDEQVRQMATQIQAEMGPIAAVSSSNKTFAPTTVVGEDGTIQRVIPQVSNGQVTNIPVGEAPVLSPEDASSLVLRETQGKADIATETAFKKKAGENQITRENKFIDNAFAAAGEMQDINRALELIDAVETGGMAAAQTRITDFFGTTTGDVGEFRRLAAQNVLNGLAAFTGAISEGERNFLESITTSLSQGKAVNKRNLARLKRIAQNSIKRGQRILERNAKKGDENAVNALADFNALIDAKEGDENAVNALADFNALIDAKEEPTPIDNIPAMTLEQLNSLNPDSLTPEQGRAASARFKELTNGG